MSAVEEAFVCSGAAPGRVVFPGDLDELQALVREAAQERHALVPAGNGTHLGIGNPPRRYDVAVSVRRLDRLVAHAAGDMTVTVEAGMNLDALDRTLAAAGQWLPIDPPAPASTTVGGMLAADRSGPLRYAHGKARDFLIGCAVVSASGELVRGGGRVVKNVAGYDLPKLMIGSYGTLGVIVEATFKVRPRPAGTRLFAWRRSSLAAALTGALVLRDAPLAASCLEVVDAASAAAIGLERHPAIVVGFAGGGSELDAQATALERVVRSRDARAADVAGGELQVFDGDPSLALWRALRDAALAAPNELLLRVSAPPTKLNEIVPRLVEETTRAGFATRACAHAGSGVARLKIDPDAATHAVHQASDLSGEGNVAAASLEGVAELVHRLAAMAAQLGAAIVCEALPRDLYGTVDVWDGSHACDPRALALMQAVKLKLDPSGVFSPGRFVAGI